MNKATIKRTYEPKQTLGKFTLFDESGAVKFECKSLELPWLNNQRKISCIPEGVYKVTRTTSPSQGVCFAVNNVPNRSNVLIHKGNYAGSMNPKTGKPDILGCIMLGTAHADTNKDGIRDIILSASTVQLLLTLVSEFELTITK